eukprot:scaffold12594_cov21-Phaeocystis_antarctica.AAC.1
MPLKGKKHLPGLCPGPADPRSGTGCARGGLPWICMGHGGNSLAACCALALSAHFFTCLATHARAAGTCRAVQARDS